MKEGGDSMRKIFKKLVLFLSLACLLILTSGCQRIAGTDTGKKAEKQTERPTGETSKAGDIQTVEAETETGRSAEEEKKIYNLYLEINNSLAERIKSCTDRYFRYVELQEEFSPKGKDYSTLSISGYLLDEAKELYRIIEDKQDKSELDQSFINLYLPMTQLVEIINKINTYTELKSYMDDDFARGKEYHRELWEVYGTYMEAIDAFQNQFAVYSAAKLVKELEDFKESGDTALYEAASALRGAKALEAELMNQKITDQNAKDIDLEKLQPLYNEFLVHVNEILELSKNEDTISSKMNSNHWKSYVDALKDTKTTMTELIQTVKEQKGSGSVSSYCAELRHMVKYYNMLLPE